MTMKVRTCTAGKGSRAALEATLRRFLADQDAEPILPEPPAGGKVVKTPRP